MLPRIPRYPLLALLLLLAAPAVLAESVYVIDVLRVGIRAEPTGSGPSEAVVKSGDKLEVLEKQGQYYRVRNAEGDSGWVNRGYVTEEPTAALQLVALKTENDQLRREIDSLKAARGSEGEEIESLQQQLASASAAQAVLSEERDGLQQRLEAITASKEGTFARYRWAFEVAVALLLLGIGLYFGRCSYRCRIRNRFGGMEL